MLQHDTIKAVACVWAHWAHYHDHAHTPEQVWSGNTSGCQLLSLRWGQNPGQLELRERERERGECTREMGGGESNESSDKFRRRGDERRRERRQCGEGRLLRGRKNKQVAFLIEESLKEGVVGAGGAAEVKAKLSHFFTPISGDSSHSGSRHRMELCVRLCDPSSAVLPYGALALTLHRRLI